MIASIIFPLIWQKIREDFGKVQISNKETKRHEMKQETRLKTVIDYKKVYAENE